MKLKLFILGFFLVLSSCATPVRKVDRPFLWEAQKDNSKIYFLGTLHLKVGLNSLPGHVREHIVRSDRVFVEADDQAYSNVSKKKADKFFKEYFKQAFEPYPNLFSKLSPRARKNVKHMLSQPDVQDYIQSLNITFDPLKEASPILVDLVYTNYILGQKRLFSLPKEMVDIYGEMASHYDVNKALSSQTVLDTQVERLAKSKGVPVFQLDSEQWLQEYYNRSFRGKSYEKFAFDKIEYQFGDGLAKEVKYRVNLDLLFEAYYSGEMKRVESLLLDNTDANFQKDLIDNRNLNWVSFMDNLDLSGTSFVAVGLAHFTGPQSLFKLFKKRGYSIQRMKY